ncbi:MAG: fibronectin type III domain-containing protein, partial [bacterium]
GGDAPDQNYQMGGMVLGRMQSPRYFGFMQFNVMPATLTNHPLEVAHAELQITPSYYYGPSYTHDSDDGPDWDSETIAHNATLWELNLDNLCPDPLADANCWSMIDNRLSQKTSIFNWDTRPDYNDPAQTTIVDTKQLAVGPANKGGKGQTTSYDVTTNIRDWYANSPQPNHGPAFMMRHSGASCDIYSPAVAHTPPPYQIEDNPEQVRRCTRFFVPPEGAQLHITYNPLLLSFGQSMLNRPGVPSFYEGILADTNHHYKLGTNPGTPAWRAVAVRGNHALEQTQPARTDLKLLDYSGAEPQVLLENTSSQNDDQTSYVLINDHACASSGICGGNVDLRAEAIATNANDYAQDQDRNYRIEYQLAQNHTLAYGTNPTIFVNDYPSDELLRVLEFELEQYDSLGIVVTGDTAVEPGLVAPTNDGERDDTVVSNQWAETSFQLINEGVGGSAKRTLEVTDIEKTGAWALVLANQEAPVPNSENPDVAKNYGYGIDIMRCPWGTIPTAKWECQPVIIPTGSTPSESAQGLTIYSEGGFVDQGGGSWCSKEEGQGTPMIGPAVDNRWVVVGQGSVCWDATNQILSTSADSGVGLAVPHPLGADRGRVSPGLMYGSTMTTLPLPSGVKTGVVGTSSVTGGQLWPTPDTRVNFAPFQTYWSEALTTDDHYIDPVTMKITGQAVLDVPLTVEASDAPDTINWDIPWTLYPGSASSYVFEPEPSQTPALHGSSSFVDLASLQLRIEGNGGPGLLQALDYRKIIGPHAWQLREADAKITQDPDMGGATKLVQAAVLPPGAPRLPATEAGAKSCSYSGQSTSCLDVRLPDYNWLNGDGDKIVQPWEMPDVHIADNASTMMLGGPNGLYMFSEDHPDSRAPQVSQSFSFDTFEATVSIDIDKCFEESTEESTVIRGHAFIGLPTVGETGVPPSVEVGFKLCDTQFAEAMLTLEIPTPGIAVGSTGVGVNLIGGKVTVGPESVQIEVTVGFQTLDGATVSDGFGTVLIDTAGLFQLTAGAKIVQALDANIKLQVAWQPLDILIEASVTCCGGLIGGELYMHAWIGQGFQDKYHWLPDNDDFHFTGYIQAWLVLEEDYIVEWVPPVDITISLKISFGEFCTNDSCTAYAWGMSAVLTVAGFDIGLYVDENGAEFIFGSDDHVLIDQHGGGNWPVTQARSDPHALPRSQITPRASAPENPVTPGQIQANLKPIIFSPAKSWTPTSPGDHGCSGNPMGPSLQCTFTVDPGVGQAVFNTAWQNGILDVGLIAPDNTPITPGNAVDYGVTISNTVQPAKQTTFAVDPLPNQETVMAGTWTLTLDDIGDGLPNSLSNNYRILWFTDPPPPAVTWTTPSLPGTMPVGDTVELQWSALRAGQALDGSVEAELIYVPAGQKPPDPTDFDGTLIANRVKAAAGSYSWDVSHLAAGEYAVGLRLDDRFAGNGPIVSWAPGTVLTNDTTPPPAPHILATTPIHDALLVTFETPNVPDLAGYLVEYTFPQPDGSARLMVRRLNPRGKWHPSIQQQFWFDGTEHVRLGGLLDNFTTDLCIRAFDNSDNVGPCQNISVPLPREPQESLGAPRDLDVNITGSGAFDVSWLPPDQGGPAAGYALTYAPLGCEMPELVSVAGEGPAPLDVGNVNAAPLSGLTPGQFYTIGVTAYDADGFVGPTANTVARYGDMSDDDGDGLPDAWAEAWGVSNAGDDPDQDGADNGEEFDQGSNPLHADSDLDGFYDGEELANGSDLCSTADSPPFQTQPKLTLFGPQELTLQVAVNETDPVSDTLNIFNLGAGNLQWQASSNQPWITLQKSGASLGVGVNPAQLSPGVHQGTVQISTTAPTAPAAQEAPAAIQETYTLPVTVHVLRQQEHVQHLP